MIGSTRAARRAGHTQACRPAISNTSETAPNAMGSKGDTFQTWRASTRAATTLASRPSAMPASSRRAPRAITIRAIVPAPAPSAIRTPISCLSCATTVDITPYTPTMASTRPKAANTDNSVRLKRGVAYSKSSSSTLSG